MRIPTIKETQWMELCEAGAQIFARCSRRQYFSVVLAPNGRVVGTGFNGVPSGLVDCTAGGCPRASLDVCHGSEYSNCLACHAEANALMWSDRFAREGGTLVVNGPPCFDCAKLIAGSGVKTLVFKDDPAYAGALKGQALMQQSGIELVKVD